MNKYKIGALSIAISLILLTVSILFGCYFIRNGKDKTQYEKQITQLNEDANTMNVAKWNIYHSSDYGYTIKIPRNWLIRTSQKEGRQSLYFGDNETIYWNEGTSFSTVFSINVTDKADRNKPATNIAYEQPNAKVSIFRNSKGIDAAEFTDSFCHTYLFKKDNVLVELSHEASGREGGSEYDDDALFQKMAESFEFASWPEDLN